MTTSTNFPRCSNRQAAPLAQEDSVFMEELRRLEEQTCCTRAQCGCLITRKGVLLSEGFAGVVPGEPTCMEAGHAIVHVTTKEGARVDHCVRCIHAEQMAIAHAARDGISLQRATAYCTLTPCPVCAKMLVFAGISRVVIRRHYGDVADGVAILRGQGIDVVYVDGCDGSGKAVSRA